MSDRDHPIPDPERPALDEEDVYVLTEQDMARIASEIYVHMHFMPELDERRAAEAADVVYQLLTGDWLQDL